jgi:hypothetical protein
MMDMVVEDTRMDLVADMVEDGGVEDAAGIGVVVLVGVEDGDIRNQLLLFPIQILILLAIIVEMVVLILEMVGVVNILDGVIMIAGLLLIVMVVGDDDILLGGDGIN